MQVNFYLRGSNKESATINCVCTFNGRRMSFSTKLVVQEKDWSQSKQRAKNSAVNQRLQEIKGLCYEEYGKAVAARCTDAAKIKTAITDRLFSIERHDDYVVPYYHRWATEPRIDKKPSRQSELSARIFEGYAQAGTRFSDIDIRWIEGFLLYMQGKNFSLNYIGTQLKNLKAMMNRAREEGLHNNTDYKKFKKMEEQTDSIYLTDDEIANLENASFSDGPTEKARDLFLVGYYTAMRFSDYSRLSLNDIRDGFIEFKTQKTGEVVKIPAKPRLVAILEKYGGRAPQMSDWELNYLIKSAAKGAGIDDLVTKNITKGGKVIRNMFPKYMLVSSHTARRSGLTNLYKSGVPMSELKFLSGHKSEASLRIYLRLTKDDMARMLAERDFFKD